MSEEQVKNYMMCCCSLFNASFYVLDIKFKHAAKV